MAFDKDYLGRMSVALNTGMVKVSGAEPAAPTMFSYISSSEAIATIVAANYFAEAVWKLSLNDLLYIVGSDAVGMYKVATIDREAGTITLVAASLTGTVNTANIADGAVTSAKLAEGLVQHEQVDLTLAEFVGMYGAPHLLVAAPGAGKKAVLQRANLWIDYGGTVLADGGAIHIQYDSTANGAGTKASGTLAAASAIAATADTTFGFSPVDTTLVDSATLNKGLYLSCATQDFTGGTSSVYKMDVWYAVADFN